MTKIFDFECQSFVTGVHERSEWITTNHERRN
nr:MAG TPA: hypothetical protein [Caudoviricetes sp.]